MNRTQGLETWPSPPTSTHSSRPSAGRAPEAFPVPILIQVPALPGVGTDSTRRRLHARPAGSRRRRRLRREVRWAGRAVLAASVLGLTFWLPWQLPARAARGVAAAAETAPDAAQTDRPRPPVVSIHVEPAGISPHAESDPPVKLPGYLLPDDGSEEPAHAGS